MLLQFIYILQIFENVYGRKQVTSTFAHVVYMLSWMGVSLWLQMNCWSTKERKKIIKVAGQSYFCDLWCWQSCSFTGLTAISIQQQPANGGLSNSSTSLPTTLAARPQSLPGPEHLLPLTMNAVTTINNTAALTLCNLDTKPSGTPDNQIREDFAILAKDSKLFTTCCLTCWLSSKLDLHNCGINLIGKYVNYCVDKLLQMMSPVSRTTVLT